MEPTPSAHLDTFARDHLPPPEQWPRLLLDDPALQYPARLNCGTELLDRTVGRLGADRPAFHTGGMPPPGPEPGNAPGSPSPRRTWSYGELRATVDRLAHVLTGELGVVPGNRVLLRGPTTPELAACWLAVMKAGAVAVTVLAAQRAHELSTICRIARVSHALCDARVAGELERAAVPGLRTGLFGGGGEADVLRLAAGKPDTFEAVATAADDVALIAFTSGTTGRPKGCAHFHRDVLAVADTFSARVLRPRPEDVFTGTPPLGFTFGLGGLVLFPLRAGASALLDQWSGAGQLLEVVGEHRISVLFTAPTAYRAMLAQLEKPGGRGPYDLSSLRRCVSAGEHLPAATWESWYERTGLRIIDGIGATEMLHIFISASDEAIRPGRTGVPVPGFEARIVAADGSTPLPDGTPGLLAVRGPVGCRYLADERQRAYVHDGWNLTGDTYVRDDEGYFRYLARADDMIISAGYNIAGPEVEEALLRHPEVREAAVVGRPDEKRGQIVVAHVVLAPEAPRGSDMAETLRRFTLSELAPYKCPREIVFAQSLPRTPTGKLQRFRLREPGLGPPEPDLE
ncbi:MULTISPECIES: AMP-binding protein [unclassified Streptomyces]|uniref:AMP-binding protein n=1 Tax=unclassified Streptomyces TaxID=2593676 RepID=UPI002DDBF9E3|nr:MULTISPECIES: AMP-binding protein [unclassified Streptomyces]WSA91831.1 AMP-binding protein [Streptomyces sp. NBC_01795]WSB76201.1 AMP-binding protein [Streptomyces sp. NBC_01775]WSS44367.1 AMP-binding protein [Streptomyces sp. NBC_01187]